MKYEANNQKKSLSKIVNVPIFSCEILQICSNLYEI